MCLTGATTGRLIGDNVIIVVIIIRFIGVAGVTGDVGEGQQLTRLTLNVPIDTTDYAVMATGLILEASIFANVAPGECPVGILVVPGLQDLDFRFLAAAGLLNLPLLAEAEIGVQSGE